MSSFVHADDLRSALSYYYLGAFRRSVDELKSVPNTVAYKEVLRLRALAEVEPAEVAKAVPSSAPTAQQAVKIYATYKAATTEDAKAAALSTLSQYLNDSDLKSDQTLQLIAATVNFAEGKNVAALTILSGSQNSLERYASLSGVLIESSAAPRAAHPLLLLSSTIPSPPSPLPLRATPPRPAHRNALQVQILLAMNRLDQADKHVKQMQAIDDDDTLTTLASAWVLAGQRDPKAAEDAFRLLAELVEKFENTGTLLNCMGTCMMLQRKFREAFGYFKRARDLAVGNKEPVPAETLVNCLVCLHHHGAGDAMAAKILEELRQLHPTHSYVKAIAAAEREIDIKE